MVAPKVFRSDDASAPALTGQVGSLVTVLDACLVNGYGSRAPAGWTKDFSGTNKAAYRMGAGGSADRMYLRVFDASTGDKCYLRGYRTMSDIDTGTATFPDLRTVSDVNGNVFWKSAAASAVVRPWVLIASPTAFWMFVENFVTILGSSGNGSNSGALGMFFGEYEKYFVGHTQNVVLLAGCYATAANYFSGGTLGKRLKAGGPVMTALDGQYLARAPYGFDASIPVAKTALMYSGFTGAGSGDDDNFGAGGPSLLPSTIDGKIRMSRIELTAQLPSWELIGRLPGAYSLNTSSFLTGNGVIDGVGDYAGQQFFVGMCGSSTGGSTTAPSQILINMTDW